MFAREAQLTSHERACAPADVHGFSLELRSSAYQKRRFIEIFTNLITKSKFFCCAASKAKFSQIDRLSKIKVSKQQYFIHIA